VSGCVACAAVTGTCTSCAAGKFYVKASNSCATCDSKTAHCTVCSNTTGVCSTCSSTYTLSTTKACGCATGLVDIGTVCKALAVCPAGTYNDGKDVCLACVSGCVACAAITGTCTSCAAGKFYVKASNSCATCDSKTPHCTACSNTTGVCSTCASTYTLSTTKACGCATGLVDIGTVCKAVAVCPAGTYNNGSDVCVTCGSGCVACTAVTGTCTSCQANHTPSTTNKTICDPTSVNCPFPVGPVESSTSV
jgi:hypothetical protein